MAVLIVLSAAMFMHVTHGARKVRSRGVTRQTLERSAAMGWSMDAQAQISGKRSAWVPMLPNPENISEECNTTLENMLEKEKFIDDLVACVPENVSFPIDGTEIERCQCAVFSRIVAELKKISTTPVCKGIAPYVAEEANRIQKTCWVHNSDSVCRELVMKATSPLEEQRVACLSRAADNWTQYAQCECESQHQRVTVFQALLQIPEATQCTHEPLGEVVTHQKLTTLQTCGLKLMYGPCFIDVYDAALQDEMSSCVNRVDWQRCDCQLIPKVLAAYEKLLAVPGPVQCFGQGNSPGRDERTNLEWSVDFHRGQLAECD